MRYLFKRRKRFPSSSPLRAYCRVIQPWCHSPLAAVLLVASSFVSPAVLPAADGGTETTENASVVSVANQEADAKRVAQAREMWAFQKPARPPVPQANDAHAEFWTRHASGVKNAVDAFILQRLAEEGLKPAPPADKRTLIRRAAFDLTGLPPTPERVKQFVNDTSEGAYAALIEELLNSPRYGERWGRHWLDVTRFADSGGYETDIFYRKAWRYRDYVIKSFNDDKPYDCFVQEQIAADEIWPDNLDMHGSYTMAPEKLRHLEALLGTGLYSLGTQIHESNMDVGKRSYERLTDWVDTTASVFLGLTFGCTRCHDHKFDPFSQRDYFRFQAVFAASKEVEIPVINPMAVASYNQHYPKLVAVDEARRAYRAFEQKTKSRNLTDADKTQKQKLWDAMARALLALPEHSPEGEGGARFDGIFEIPAARVLGHERPALARPVRRLERGNIRAPAEIVNPGIPVALAAASGENPTFSDRFTRRKELALWLTRGDHPLTARVMVNRIWLWHFGDGIVSTPNDFGSMGQSPSHPELLDWLATEFVARKWSIKEMHRLIMLSGTYQRSSRFAGEQHVQVDPDNRLLWRINRRRLESEALWDSIHSVAGTLNLKMGGRPVVPPLAADEIAALRDKWQWPVSGDPKEHTRRGVYILVRRNFGMPMFEAFDSPVNSFSCPRRDVTTVATQALWFLNNETVVRQATRCAARLVQEVGDEPTLCVERLWRLALGRPPTETEAAEALALLKELIDADAPKATVVAATTADSPAAESPGPATNDAGTTSVEKSGDKLVQSPLVWTDLPVSLQKLPKPRATALIKLCLAIFNLNEFAYVD